MNIYTVIDLLVSKAQKTGLIEKEDTAYAKNMLFAELRLDGDTEAMLPADGDGSYELHTLLDYICDYARDEKIAPCETVTERDLYDTKIMGLLCPRPSEVISRFNALYRKSPADATDYFYSLSIASNYIREDRIRRDLKWKSPSKYGELDITVNLSKPEKDPKAIAAARLLSPSGYPKCALCHENEGFSGNLSKPARQTLRQIPFDMAGTLWYLQYSPYVYYNEHCIAVSSQHTPMKIDSTTFDKLLSFITVFPHYFIGSNADLPIVGGSILSHDHMQGGRFVFPMERAKVDTPLTFRGFEDIKAGIVRWPMSVIRLEGSDKARLSALATKILTVWREYTDSEAEIFAYTDSTPHNTITPIARRCGESYQLDLVLRNNLTTEQYPLGLYHPHPEHHSIKKENIGLIEVMGLAVLPSRLKGEIAIMKKAILEGRAFSDIPEIAKHESWYSAFAGDYSFTEENTEDILKAEIGKTFCRVLEDSGVYKDTPQGRAAFLRFTEAVNGQ